MKQRLKYLIRDLLRKGGIDIRPAGQVRDVMDFVKHRRIGEVIDVGANIGQFGALLRAQGYRGKITSFEPIRSAFEKLSQTAAADRNWHAHNFALGATPGEAVINVARHSVYSSILPAANAAAEFDEGSLLEHTETIQVRTLDEFALSGSSGAMLLKIDTQGYEKQVLEGGRVTLPRFQGILMELPLIQLYEGNWQFHEAVAFLAEAGFVPAQIHPVNYHSKDPVSLVEVDCLFRPANK